MNPQNVLTPDQNSALLELTVGNGPPEPKKVSFKRELPFDGRPTTPLSVLAQQTGFTVSDLYNRARGRGLLIQSESGRVPASERLIYREDIEVVVAPKRGGDRDEAKADPPGERILPTPVPKEDNPKLRVFKLIRLVRAGHLEATEALDLIEAVLMVRG